MPNIRYPRRGSLQFWPRCRARRIYARIKNWPKVAEAKLLGFAGYKVGMTHVMIDDNTPSSLTKGETISCPVTVIECPPLKTYSIRFYQKTNNGLKLVSEIFAKSTDKELKRKVGASKKQNKEPENFDEIRLAVYTQPRLIGLKKKPELFEMGLGGKDNQEKLKYAKEILDKEVRLSNVFKEGQYIDTHSITKAKGFQGSVKRFGVRIRQHKAEKTKRGPATLGSWTPKKTDWRVAQAGKMGFHQRTEFNKLALKISTDPKEIAMKGGFLHYGNIKNDFIILKGSVAGTIKRLITLTEPSRPKQKNFKYEVSSVSLASKQ